MVRFSSPSVYIVFPDQRIFQGSISCAGPLADSSEIKGFL